MYSFIICLTSQAPLKNLFAPEFLLRLIACDLHERQNVALFEFYMLKCTTLLEDLEVYELCFSNI